MLRSILVHADSRPAMGARIETALNLARAHGAHLTFHINAPLYPLVAIEPFAGAALPQSLVDDVRRQADELVAAIDTKMADEDVPWTCTTGELDLTEGLVRAARFADLVIVPIARPESGGRLAAQGLAGALALNARCPVLALPESLSPLWLDGPAMVAWNGSAEAAHALRGALPMLAMAKSVHLVTVTEKENGFPATDALRYLSHHGIHAEAAEQPRGALTIEEVLERAADTLGADFVVMGAFGHSRLRETLFGGVTRYMVDGAQRPLVLVH